MKSKSFTALLLALGFSCSLLALQACSKADEGATTPPTQEEILPDPPSGDLGENENGNLENGGGMVENTPVFPENSTPSQPPENSGNGSLNSPSVPKKEKQTYIRCVGNNVNLRSGAGTNYTVLGTAEKNTTYAVVGQKGNWYETYYRGKRAYFYAEYAAVMTIEKSEDKDVENVIEEGYKLIGVPYVYGAVRVHNGKGKLLSGFSAQKFDCSSLIQYIFYKGADVLLQVNTRTQVVQGKRVKSGDLQRGDCMYFTNSERKHLKGVERIGHVALYLGNDYILHTASDYARIEKISATRWSYFIEARRFL